MTAAEVDWLVAQEFARTAEDTVWRRTKIGLRMTSDEIGSLQAYLGKSPSASGESLTNSAPAGTVDSTPGIADPAASGATKYARN